MRSVTVFSAWVFLNSLSLPQESKEVYSLFYFGATSCTFCIVPQNIENIKKLRKEFSEKYNHLTIKFVMVCMDKNIEDGLEYVKKYGEYWDEISIGKFYENELVMNNLNKAKIPGVPHIIVYKDTLIKMTTPVIKSRKIVVDLLGADQIQKWISSGYPL
jgi:hypothetical protein